MSLYLGIDTSNYTTSLALADENGILENLKLPLAVAEDAVGLRQSDAVFAHVKNLPLIFEKLGARNICALGYSGAPRDSEGSYMPCFLTGEMVGRAVGALLGIPVYRFSHQRGHLMAAAYSAGCLPLLAAPMLAFHVSGGTTDLLLCDKQTVTQIGKSADLHAGQAVDRIGKLLGLRFPCGMALEALAKEADAASVPYCKICVKDCDCHLSGLENQAQKLLATGVPHAVVARYTLHFLMYTLATMTKNARAIYGNLPVLYAGGVMSNGLIQAYLRKMPDTYFAAPAFSADNAAGIALLCREAAQANG